MNVGFVKNPRALMISWRAEENDVRGTGTVYNGKTDSEHESLEATVWVYRCREGCGSGSYWIFHSEDFHAYLNTVENSRKECRKGKAAFMHTHTSVI